MAENVIQIKSGITINVSVSAKMMTKIKIEDFDLDNILRDEKWYKNILVYSILCKTLIGAEPLRIRFDKVDEFIRIYDGTRYLVSFGG